MCVCVGLQLSIKQFEWCRQSTEKYITSAISNTTLSLSPSIVKEEEDRERGFQRKISSTESLTT